MIIVVFANYISQDIVATVMVWWNIIFNSHFFAYFPRYVPSEKKFENRSIYCKDMGKNLSLTFFDSPCISFDERNTLKDFSNYFC